MIWGITIAKNPKKLGFGIDLVINSWLRVCDKIIIVIGRHDPDTQSIIRNLSSDRILIRGVENNSNFESYRNIGYFYMDNPNFVVHFDLDYLISPEDSKILKNDILSSDENVDIITYNLIYLNYWGDKTIYSEDMERWVWPHNGYIGEYPFIINYRRGNIICPFEGVDKWNTHINYESIICTHPDRLGNTYATKYLRDNPHGFKIINSKAEIEHLTWSYPKEYLEFKLGARSGEYRNGVTIDYVKSGMFEWGKSYQELDEFRKRIKENESAFPNWN